MKIIFLCRTGHHTAMLAAGLYLGLIKGSKGLRSAVAGIRGWDNISLKEIGTPFYVGKDKDNNEIYTIGIGRQTTLMERAVHEMINLIGVEQQDRRIINVSQAVTRWTKLGLATKKLHMNSLAKLLFNLGVESELKSVLRVLGKHGFKPC